MRTNLLASLSGAWLAVAGCTTHHTNVAAPPPAYGPPPSPAPSRHIEEEARPYTYRQPQPSQAPQPAPDYREQAPAYDPSTQDAPPTSIQRVEDFDEPLREYGRWLDTPEYGRVWQPYDQPTDWRPYASEGQWVYTSWGWTWQSYQPWGWATYHYGNWVFMPRCGWVWIAGVIWSPAWVVWRECDDYVAWAPAPPARFHFFYSSSDYFDWGVRYCDYVVVPRSRFCQPIHPRVAVPYPHNVKFVTKTKNVTKTKFVNKGVINHGPSVAKVEAATGQKVRPQKVADVVQPPERFAKRTGRESAQDENEKPARNIRRDFEPPSKKRVEQPQPLANTVAPAPPSASVEPRKSPSEERPDRREATREEPKIEKQKERVAAPSPALPTRSEPAPVKTKVVASQPPPEPRRMDRPGREEPKAMPVARPKQNTSREDDREAQPRPRREQPAPSAVRNDLPRRNGADRAVQLSRSEPQREERVQYREAKADKSNREVKSAASERANRESGERRSRERKGDQERGESFTDYRR